MLLQVIPVGIVIRQTVMQLLQAATETIIQLLVIKPLLIMEMGLRIRQLGTMHLKTIQPEVIIQLTDTIFKQQWK